jgi:hypothetical protein
MDSETKRLKVMAKHYRTEINHPDYIQMARKRCDPYVNAIVEAVRAIPDIPEKKGLMSAVIEFSRATEKHIANLEFEMTSVEYEMSKLWERNTVLEEETKRCHAKIDITDDISLSMAKLLENKLRC